MSDSAAVRALRRQLGHQLAAARKNAGYGQRDLARRISYARSTLSTVESGIQRAGRAFWEACDNALGTGGELALGYDRIRAQLAAERQNPSALTPAPGEQREGLRAATLPEALRAYRTLGWPAVADGGVAELVTGTVLDALRVPRVAGILAACWWQGTEGSADPIRGLPALPNPRRALAVIACGGHCYFLAAAGSYPWAGQDHVDVPPAADTPVIGWHSGGSRIPAPPGISSGGQQATWAYLPPGQIQLASPVMLLDLLARAVITAGHRPRTLALPGGVLAVPVLGSSPSPALPPQP
jgi:transcriptional regulator with XRE-family HTH domain